MTQLGIRYLAIVVRNEKLIHNKILTKCSIQGIQITLSHQETYCVSIIFLSLIFEQYAVISLSLRISGTIRGGNERYVSGTPRVHRRAASMESQRVISTSREPRLCHKYSATKNPYSCCRSRAKDVDHSPISLEPHFIYRTFSSISAYPPRSSLYIMR